MPREANQETKPAVTNIDVRDGVPAGITPDAMTEALNAAIEEANSDAPMRPDLLATKDRGEPVEMAEEPEPAEAPPPAAEPPEPDKQEAFSRISRADLDDPRLQRMYDQLQLDYQQKVSSLGDPGEDRELVKQNASFLRYLSQNPEVAQRVSQVLRGETPASAKQEPAKPQAPAFKLNAEELGVDDETLPVFEKFGQALLTAMQQQVHGALAGVRETVDRMNGVFHQAEADRELGDLNGNYPGWQAHVDPKSLAAAKKFYADQGVDPKLVPARMLYQAMDYARLQNENEVLKKNAQQRTPEAPRGRVVGTRPVAAVPSGRRQETVRQVTDVESALEAAFEQLGINTGR